MEETFCRTESAVSDQDLIFSGQFRACGEDIRVKGTVIEVNGRGMVAIAAHQPPALNPIVLQAAGWGSARKVC